MQSCRRLHVPLCPCELSVKVHGMMLQLSKPLPSRPSRGSWGIQTQSQVWAQAQQKGQCQLRTRQRRGQGAQASSTNLMRPSCLLCRDPLLERVMNVFAAWQHLQQRHLPVLGQ